MKRGEGTNDDTTALDAAIEEAKRRCRAVKDRIESLNPFSNGCRKNRLNDSCMRTLLRLVNSELSFLSRLSLSPPSYYKDYPNPSLSINIGHLDAVVYILQQPFISSVSRVCKPIPLPPSVENEDKGFDFRKGGIYVDIVCTIGGNPFWFIVSDRNPKHVSWHGSNRNKGLRIRIEQVLNAARGTGSLRPYSIVIFFSNGLEDCILQKLRDEFGAADFEMEFSCFDCVFSEELDSEWMNVVARSYRQAHALKINVDCSGDVIPRLQCGVKESFMCAAKQDFSEELFDLNLGTSFWSLISRMKVSPFVVEDVGSGQPPLPLCKSNFINFDTTALIAIVSGISNGSAERILSASETELRIRFKSNYEFVISQVMSEIQNPIHVELADVLSENRGMACESVVSEFKELVFMCGGPKEKLRANHLLVHLFIVPDCPSARMMSLPTTRKLARKNKVVFGTGDYWHAPTLTANMAFVRAISQVGMPLFTIEHRPRALTGD